MIAVSREEELDKLRLKIMEAIRFSKRYWMIYKEKTFGIATILDLIYKKSYIEVLFFTNYDVIELGVPLLTINTPIETEVNLNDILLEPDFDSDGLISPTKIIYKLNQLIEDEFQHHIDILDEEVQLIKEKYENYEINGIPYNREIRIYFPQNIFELTINFEKYPLIPFFHFSDNLSKIIKLKEFIQLEIFENWNQDFPIHIVKIIKILIKELILRLEINNLPKNSQHVLIEKLTIGKSIRNLSFKLLKGESIGIIHKNDSWNPSKSNENEILKLFNAINGNFSNFDGIIKIFGKNIQLALKNELEKIILINNDNSPKISNLTVKKAMNKDLGLIKDWKVLKQLMDNLIKRAGIIFKRGEMRYKTLEHNYKKSIIDQILKDTGLLNRKTDKIKDLSPLDSLLLSISTALLKSPNLILLLTPNIRLGRLELEKLSNIMNKIENNYHVSFIIHGGKELVSICDQIINITPEKTEIGSVEDYIHKLPQSGEIITIELSQPKLDSLKKMLKFKSVIFIEERRNEKYKLFIQEDPEKIIMALLELFGSKLYNFKRFRATLGEYLEFLEYNKYGRLYK